MGYSLAITRDGSHWQDSIHQTLLPQAPDREVQTGRATILGRANINGRAITPKRATTQAPLPVRALAMGPQ